jgi:penicillin-binding protein 1A
MDRTGKTVWRADQRDCSQCQNPGWEDQMMPPDIPDNRDQIEDPRTSYQMVSILEGVVERGTAVSLHTLGIPLAGKTGTTNEDKDAWFIGFTPDLVCGVYVGFDDPKPLGMHETGASVAVPIFRDFIVGAMAGKPAVPFRVPPGLRMVRVNPDTGALSTMADKNAIWESFVPGTEPEEDQPRPVLDGSVTGSASQGAAAAMMPGVVGAIPSSDTPQMPNILPQNGQPSSMPQPPVMPAIDPQPPSFSGPTPMVPANPTPGTEGVPPTQGQSPASSTTEGTGGLY